MRADVLCSRTGALRANGAPGCSSTRALGDTRMPPASIRSFRIAAVVALAAMFGVAMLTYLDLVTFDEEVQAARSWNYYGSILPIWAIYLWFLVWSVITSIGLIGLCFFWRPSRMLLAAGLLLSLVAQPFLGLVVYSPLEAAMAGLSGMLMLWLVTMSFWSALSTRFDKSPDRVA
jgi:hypothetical protein